MLVQLDSLRVGDLSVNAHSQNKRRYPAQETHKKLASSSTESVEHIWNYQRLKCSALHLKSRILFRRQPLLCKYIITVDGAFSANVNIGKFWTFNES